MEGASAFILLYPLVIAVTLVVRGVGFVLSLPYRIVRHHKRHVAQVQLDSYILTEARKQAWAIHQATHPNPLKTPPWEG